MSDIQIQTPSADDIPALTEVVEATGLFPAELFPDMLRSTLQGQDDALWLVGRIDGVGAGFCYAIPEPMTDGTWNMLALATHPNVQRQGIATQLLQSLVLKLQTKGQRLLIVDTSGQPAFDGARSFYLGNGFEEEARLRDYWAEGDDKITFRRQLA